MAKVLGLGLGKGLSMAPSVMRVSLGRDTDEAEDRQEELDFKPDMEAVGDFVGHVLIAAAQVHMLHFQASSYAKHIALNELYDAIPDDIDAIAEEFQALYENIPSYNSYVSFNQNPIIYVQDLLDFVHENRSCMGPHSSMQSLIDILESTIKSTLYKLKKLN
jgi:DNA-binding ferritin-like protein